MAFRLSAPLGARAANAQPPAPGDLNFAKNLYKLPGAGSRRGSLAEPPPAPPAAAAPPATPTPTGHPSLSLGGSVLTIATVAEVASAAPLPFSPASTVRSLATTGHRAGGGGVDSPGSVLGVDAGELPLPQPTGIAALVQAQGTPARGGGGGQDDDDLAGADDRSLASPGGASSASGFGETQGSLGVSGPMPPMPGGGGGAALPLSPAGSTLSAMSGGSMLHTPGSYFRPDSAVPELPGGGGTPGTPAGARGPAVLPGSGGSVASGRTAASSVAPPSSSRRGGSKRAGGLLRFLALPSSPGGRSAATSGGAGGGGSPASVASSAAGGRGASPAAAALGSPAAGGAGRKGATGGRKAPSPRSMALRRVLSMRVPQLVPPPSAGGSPGSPAAARSPAAFPGSANKPEVSSPLARDALRKGMVSPAALNPAGRRALWRAASDAQMAAPGEAEESAPALAPAAAAAAAATAPQAPAMATTTWEAAITATALAGGFPNRHTEYTVEVVVAGGAGGAPRALTLHRRYREFAALWRVVADPGFGSDAPAWGARWSPAVRRFRFPPKVLFRPTRPGVVEERREALGGLLALLAAAAGDVPEVAAELGVFCGLEEGEEDAAQGGGQ